ncbi:MAG: prepilin-type N-terminal cleavage/methylation domain-containing protein [Planctomycetes bacterium]|nr:prepilin-type N-terminal cleavage/methylation domain-containing protein [Planctomycetota bacterium]
MTNHRAGVTLIEVVVVIVIISLLLGLSVALYRNANRDLGVRAAAGHLVAVLRAARDEARATRSPAWVVLDVAGNAVYAMTKETAGEWHFEDTVTTGAFGKNGRVTNGVLVPGRVGSALQMTGSTTVDCGEFPVYAEDQGVAIEFWFYRVDAPRRQMLCAIGPQLEMSIEANGQLVARIGTATLSSGSVTFRGSDRWYRIHLVFNGREAQLVVNDALLATGAVTMKWTKGQALVLGASKGGCQGILDEFRVSLIFARERYLLPSEAKFDLPQGYLAPKQTEFVIHFDGEGRLDPRKHSNQLRIKIKSPAEEKEITINPTGMVQR